MNVLSWSFRRNSDRTGFIVNLVWEGVMNEPDRDVDFEFTNDEFQDFVLDAGWAEAS